MPLCLLVGVECVCLQEPIKTNLAACLPSTWRWWPQAALKLTSFGPHKTQLGHSLAAIATPHACARTLALHPHHPHHRCERAGRRSERGCSGSLCLSGRRASPNPKTRQGIHSLHSERQRRHIGSSIHGHSAQASPAASPALALAAAACVAGDVGDGYACVYTVYMQIDPYTCPALAVSMQPMLRAGVAPPVKSRRSRRMRPSLRQRAPGLWVLVHHPPHLSKAVYQLC